MCVYVFFFKGAGAFFCVINNHAIPGHHCLEFMIDWQINSDVLVTFPLAELML